MKTFEEKLEAQVNLNEPKVYEAFVNQNELAEYLELSSRVTEGQMQKVYLPVFEEEIVSICFSQDKAIAALVNEAGVDTIEEFIEEFVK